MNTLFTLFDMVQKIDDFLYNSTLSEKLVQQFETDLIDSRNEIMEKMAKIYWNCQPYDIENFEKANPEIFAKYEKIGDELMEIGLIE